MQKPTEFCPQESIKTFGLLDLSRSFPLSGILVGDEQYAIHNEAPKSGEFYFRAEKNTINETCAVHAEAPPVIEEPPVEEEPETDEPTSDEPILDEPSDEPIEDDVSSETTDEENIAA